MRRQIIIDNLKNRLKTIEWKPNLFEWLVSPLSPSDLPAIILKDTDDQVDSEQASGSSSHSLKIEILLFVSDEALTPKSLREKILDVLVVIGKESAEGEDLGDYISFDSVEIDFEHQDQMVGMAQIEVTIKYYTEKWSI